MSGGFPKEIRDDVRRAKRLAWWTIAAMVSVILVMALVMGQSQAMRTAWIEDILSIVPSAVLLISLHMEAKRETPRFNFGFDRAHSLAFLVAAVALVGLGIFLLFESVMTLALREHVTIPSVFLFGQQIWLGWLMIAALAFSIVPPLLLGRMKLPVAQRLADEVMHTDAMMQKADWMTGLAGIAGIVGIGFGLWWADAAAAGFIAFSILHDGIRALRVSTAELIDGVPRELGEKYIAKDAKALIGELARLWPGSEIRLRESGRYILAEIEGAVPDRPIVLDEIWPGDPKRSWRLAQLSFVPCEGADARP